MTLFTFPFYAMGGQNEIQLYALTKVDAERLSQLAIREVNRIEAKYSRYQSESIISRINLEAHTRPIEVDDETAGLLNYAAECYHQSSGLFDITSGVLRRIWNFKEKSIPTQAEITKTLALIGWNKLDWRAPSIMFKKAGMEIDFGGLGKEYAVDRVIGLLKNEGVSSALVNLGGDLRVLGGHPNGRAWHIGVADPREKGGILAEISLASGALATSGDYERCIEIGGKRYCHILNPKTGWPATDIQSISVIADSCLVAGTLTTTAMLLGEPDGMNYLNNLSVKYLLLNSNSRIISTTSI